MSCLIYKRTTKTDALGRCALSTRPSAGDKDWMMLMTPQVKDIVKLNADYLKFHIIPDAGHHLYIDNAPVFNDLVVQQLWEEIQSEVT